MKNIKEFGLFENIDRYEIKKRTEEKTASTRSQFGKPSLGTKSDFAKFPTEEKLAVYNEDWLISRDCKLTVKKTKTGEVHVNIEQLLISPQDGTAQLVLRESDGIAETYEEAYLFAVESLLD